MVSRCAWRAGVHGEQECIQRRSATGGKRDGRQFTVGAALGARGRNLSGARQRIDYRYTLAQQRLEEGLSGPRKDNLLHGCAWLDASPPAEKAKRLLVEPRWRHQVTLARKGAMPAGSWASGEREAASKLAATPLDLLASPFLNLGTPVTVATLVTTLAWIEML